MYLALAYMLINEPVATMREEPNHKSRVVSQAILGEQVEILEEQPNWAKIKTPDNYDGWVSDDSIVRETNSSQVFATVSRLAAHVFDVKDTEFGPIKTLPFEAKVQVVDDTDPRWSRVALPDGKLCYIQKGDIAPLKKLQSKEELVEFSSRFLGLPYTWGGRSSFGYDCSGFVQMLYNQIGIRLERDSKLQINDPRFATIDFDKIEPGDLVFFGKGKRVPNHVGMAIGNGQFIHSTVRENQPWIRISNLADYEWNENIPYREARQLIKR